MCIYRTDINTVDGGYEEREREERERKGVALTFLGGGRSREERNGGALLGKIVNKHIHRKGKKKTKKKEVCGIVLPDKKEVLAFE